MNGAGKIGITNATSAYGTVLVVFDGCLLHMFGWGSHLLLGMKPWHAWDVISVAAEFMVDVAGDEALP
jgi:hypothetical protein